ncbi:diphthine synthase [Methanocella conradii HZ254]|uniref:Diphthine synthase n=1 Tax=Methanocella conradii (strain DSM 24694 / JCM 17849 / CGMCC 1.5162 / HZ254) TaxID=1041930 RepID=H8I7F4_METCZ|nr:diphthine synthase [Methanocella conradii]AFD00820.1 diphthine synthase [Methanocella conradii HZ254]
MLTFIGLGLWDEKDISLKGLEAIKKADVAYAEFYTSRLMGATLEKLEALYGKPIKVLDREDVEQHPEDSILKDAVDKDVVFLTGGDAMVATTHVDLRLRAQKMGIQTAVIHGASIASAVCGVTGLQNYRFGKSATIAFPYRSIVSETPYDTIKMNKANGLHTLLFLDIDKAQGYMTINKGIELLLLVEERRKEGVLRDALGVGVARAGSPEPCVKAARLDSLKSYDFGGPLHILVIPAELHFLEEEALEALAGLRL